MDNWEKRAEEKSLRCGVLEECSRRSWRDKVTNEEVIKRIMEKGSLLTLRKGEMNGLAVY